MKKITNKQTNDRGVGEAITMALFGQLAGKVRKQPHNGDPFYLPNINYLLELYNYSNRQDKSFLYSKLIET